jgi:hypothetical protein
MIPTALGASGLTITALLFLVLVIRHFFFVERRETVAWLLLVTLAAIPAGAVSQALLGVMSQHRTARYDLYVFEIDRYFGNPSFALGKIVTAHHGLWVLLATAYGLLIQAMLLTFAINVWLRGHREGTRVLVAFLLNLFAALPLYWLFPVSGPFYAFASFPNLPARVAPHLIVLTAAPNGVPSVHMSTALLVFWFLRRWQLGRVIGIVFLALTVLATLGGGENYLFDLLMAVPYTAAILWITARLPQAQREVVTA